MKGITSFSNDWNNCVEQGLYAIKGLKCTNMPQNAYNFGVLIVLASDDIVVQFYLAHNQRDFYYRIKYIGASIEWDAWSIVQKLK